MAIKGVGPVVGAQLLLTAGDNPDRLRSSPSFAALCGTAPIPVSSGRTDRHRLSRRLASLHPARHRGLETREGEIEPLLAQQRTREIEALREEK